MSNIGFRICKSVDRINPAIIAGFKGIAASNIADVMGRFRAMDHAIKSVNKPGIHVVGSAFTVRTHPSDNLMVHKAMDLAKPGDLIVIDASGDMVMRYSASSCVTMPRGRASGVLLSMVP